MSGEGESRPLAENEDDRKPVKGCCGRMRSLVTVEPIAFLYILAAILANSTNQQYASYYNAVQMGGDVELLSVGICELGNNDNSKCHYTETSSLLALCEGNPPVTGIFPSQMDQLRDYQFPVVTMWQSKYSTSSPCLVSIVWNIYER